MTTELNQLRNELAKSNNHEPTFLRGCIADLIKDKADRNLLNICMNAGVLQDFFLENTHDTFFINRCKTRLVVDFFITETAADKAIELCWFLVSDEKLDDLPELIPYRKEHKWGYCDRNKNIVIPAQFDSVNLFYEGFAIVVDYYWVQAFNEDHCGPFVIDKLGQKIIKAGRFVDLKKKFSEGLLGASIYIREFKASCLTTNNRWGFIDKAGNAVIPFAYDEVGDFNDGLASCCRENRWGFIDKTGREIIPIIYCKVGIFKEGLVRVLDYDTGGWGFIDKTGQNVIPCKHYEVSDFEDGYASVIISGDYRGGRIIDKFGNKIYEKDDLYILRGFKEGIALASSSPIGEIGFIDKTGKIMISIEYWNADDFNEGLARVEINERWGFIDKTGSEIISLKYENAKSFKKGLACVGSNDKFGFINKTGKEIISLKYDEAEDFDEGLARVNINNKWGYIDKNGTEYWED